MISRLKRATKRRPDRTRWIPVLRLKRGRLTFMQRFRNAGAGALHLGHGDALTLTAHRRGTRLLGGTLTYESGL